jgi:glyoxylase-like metal-dependent hydrolase (beta-lactamase superfamily II)
VADLSRRSFLRASGVAACVAGFGAALSATACSGGAWPAAPLPPSAGATDIGRFASPNPGSVNTFWMRAPDGILVVDSGRNIAGGRRAVAEIQRIGLPVLGILITHPHPDHVGGLGEFRAAFPQTPTYASEATTSWMRRDPLGFYALARQADADYPATLTYPDRTFGPDETLDIGGLRIETAEYGPGESETATVFYEPVSAGLFVGDLVCNGATPALLEGDTCGWLSNIDQLQARFPRSRVLYPGHGAPGEPALIEQQRIYLERYREFVEPAVRADSPAGPDVSPEEQASIIARIDGEYPGYERVASLETLQELNVNAVAGELRDGRC